MKTPSPITLKTNLKVTPIVEDAVVDTASAEEEEIVFSGNDRVPAYWDISALENDEIEAKNSTTGSYFKGTMADFKKCLRG